jgi:hypothetical protein
VNRIMAGILGLALSTVAWAGDLYWSDGSKAYNDVGLAYHQNGTKAWDSVGLGYHSNGAKAWDNVGLGYHADGTKAWDSVGLCYAPNGSKVGEDSCVWSWGPGVTFSAIKAGDKWSCTLMISAGVVPVHGGVCL